MSLLYNTGIQLTALLYALASLFNRKARAFVRGRRALIAQLRSAYARQTAPVIWIHCASLGEFEQGRPLIERMKVALPDYSILLTFFSPSGYEVRHNYAQADHVFYLPWDTPRKAREFVEAVNPVLAVFVKYEFWYNYTRQLTRRNIPVVSVSSIFRNNQIFFRPAGSFFRSILRNFTHFYVQDDESLRLLKGIGITQCTIAGDTRFDRVQQIAALAAEMPEIQRFKENQRIMVIGSSWPEDHQVLIPFINNHRYQLKFIIAPHEISEANLHHIERQLTVKHLRFSALAAQDPSSFQVLIIDNVGLLSSLYRYGEYAFVGGAYGAGLHNTLEPACHGLPVFFGDKNYKKFREAVELLGYGAAFTIHDTEDLVEKYEMINTPDNFMGASQAARLYVQENTGATEKIIEGIRSMIP